MQQEGAYEKKKNNSLSFYTDVERLSSFLVFIVLFTLLVLYPLHQQDEGTNLISRILAYFSIIILLFFLSDIKCFFVKNTFSEQGISCILFGIKIKEIKWEQINHIVSAIYLMPFTDNKQYVFFSGHELSEEEKKHSVRIAAKKNDVVVLPAGKNGKNIEMIKEIHDFELESTRDIYKYSFWGFKKDR